jgi:hypothetical protein
MRGWITSVLLATIFLSCEKTINLDVDKQPARLVVDASIEDGMPPVIVLSKSLAYFSTISSEELSASFVHDAEIFVSDGASRHLLKEYEYIDTNGITLYYYTTDSSHLESAVIGKRNHEYHLSIETAEGSVYNGVTTIPSLAKTVDSLWWKPAPQNSDTSRVVLYGRFTDPKGFGNYIRYFSRINSERFLPGIASVFDDQIVDGTTYDFLIDKGFDKNGELNFSDEDYGFFHRGDTVTIKFCNIDKATYDFWRTWEYNYQSNGNPFSSPIKVLSNIDNGALGTFSGYAVQYKSIIIPH